MKKILFLAMVTFLVIIIINLAISIVTLWSKRDLLTQTQHELTQEQQQHQQLQQQLKQVTAPGFVEEQARDRLFLAKPGEVIVLFPSASPSAAPMQRVAMKPIWQQWFELFF